MDNENGKWVTINGAHVFIRNGETTEQALARLQEKPKKYYKVTFTNGYGSKSTFIVPDTDIDKYEGYDIEEIDLSEDFKFLDSLDLNRSRQSLIYEIRNKSYPGPEQKFLVRELLNRISEHQQTLADEYLSHVRKHKDVSLEESVMEINKSHYDTSKSKPYNSPEYAAYTYNCQRCVQAFVLRYCYGYDVEAMPSDDIWNEKKNEFEDGPRNQVLLDYCIKNDYNKDAIGLYRGWVGWSSAIFNLDDVHKTLMSGYDIADKVGYKGTEDQFRYIKKTVKNAGDGAVYICSVAWKGTKQSGGSYSAHVFCIINEKGKVKCYDPQSGEECSRYFTDKQIVPRETDIFRADNCRLNGTMMKEVVVGYDDL